MNLTIPRQKILRVSPFLFLELCKRGLKGEVDVINPIPEDSTLIRVIQEPVFGDLCLVIHSESFPILNDGEAIPHVEKPLFEKVR